MAGDGPLVCTRRLLSEHGVGIDFVFSFAAFRLDGPLFDHVFRMCFAIGSLLCSLLFTLHGSRRSFTLCNVLASVFGMSFAAFRQDGPLFLGS
jgi:hypothetical protein